MKKIKYKSILYDFIIHSFLGFNLFLTYYVVGFFNFKRLFSLVMIFISFFWVTFALSHIENFTNLELISNIILNTVRVIMGIILFFVLNDKYIKTILFIYLLIGLYWLPINLCNFLNYSSSFIVYFSFLTNCACLFGFFTYLRLKK